MTLAHFIPMFNFYTWKCQENFGFLTFSGSIEMKHWRVKDYMLATKLSFIRFSLFLWKIKCLDLGRNSNAIKFLWTWYMHSMYLSAQGEIFLKFPDLSLNVNICWIMMMNCFCETVDLRTTRSRICRRDHRQEASPWWRPNTVRWQWIPDHCNSNP